MGKDKKIGFISRLFGKKSDNPENGKKLLPSNEARLGLCFHYERGINFCSEFLSEVGLKYILKELKRQEVKATFFCPARLAETVPEHVTGLYRRGHEIAALGNEGEAPAEQTDDGVKQLVYTCRAKFANIGVPIVGFRAPHGQWDERLCRELARQKYRYSAEHEHTKGVYVITPGKPPLYRVPIYSTDKGLLRREETVNRTISKHHRLLRKASEGRHFTSVCFHAWILAEEKDRMQHFIDWLNAAVKLGIKIGPLRDALPPVPSNKNAVAEET